VSHCNLSRGLALAGAHDPEQLLVRDALGGLADHGPVDVAEVRHHVQVAQEPEAAAPDLVEELAVEPLGLVVPLLAVAVQEGTEPLRV
jgi:hypothetical protein